MRDLRNWIGIAITVLVMIGTGQIIYGQQKEKINYGEQTIVELKGTDSQLTRYSDTLMIRIAVILKKLKTLSCAKSMRIKQIKKT